VSNIIPSELAAVQDATILKNWARAPYASLKDTDWEGKIAQRGVDHKRDKALAEALPMYLGKIQKLSQAYNQVAAERQNLQASLDKIIEAKSLSQSLLPLSDQETALLAKLDRIREKVALIAKEQELRAAGVVRTDLHDTVYYIDLSGGSGDDGHTGLSTAQAWLTIEKYTSVTVRTPGDIAWVRANTTEIPAGIIDFDESGTVAARIEIRGCSAAAGEDPWGDLSNVKPIINFNATTNKVRGLLDSLWRLYRLDVTNNSGGTELVGLNQSHSWIVDTCDIHLSTGAAGTGLYFYNSAGGVATNCTFYSNVGANINMFNSTVTLIGCVLNGGVGTVSLIGVAAGGIVYMQNCTFGVTTHHTTASISMQYNSAVSCLNCLFSDGAEVSGIAVVGHAGTWVRSEDHNQVKGASKAWYYNGIVIRDTAVPIDALDSVNLAPNANCGLNTPFTESSRPLQGDYQIWCPAAATTITIKAREKAAWAADPTATEFYFRASYLSAAPTAATRSVVDSAQTLAGVAEVSFTMTFVPAQAGWVYITANLKKYEAGKSVNISVKPALS
jgi:hypothetical protein